MRRVIGFALGGALSAGCSSGSSPVSPTDGGSTSDAPTSDAPTSDAPTSDSTTDSGLQPSPAILRQFESGAEAMSESPRGQLPQHLPDWQGAMDAYTADMGLWTQVKPLVQSAGASTSTINEIESALAAYLTDVNMQKQREAETDANRITLAVPDLFDHFYYAAPTDTLRLDGTFRQTQIDAEYADWAAAQKDLDRTKMVWANLKPKVAAEAPNRPDIAGAATVVADVDGTLNALQLSIGQDGSMPTDVADVETLAQKGLDETDTCEQIFVGNKGCIGPHFVVDPADNKCKLDGKTTNVGAPCSASNPAVCGIEMSASCLDPKLDDYPGGYCNVDPCTNKEGNLCPVGASCVMLNGENGQCFKNCTMDSDCRTTEGYFCLDMTADDRPGGLWVSGASHKLCSRGTLICPSSPQDCPSGRPHCVLPNDGGPASTYAGTVDATAVDGAGDAASDAAPVAPPTPICFP
jgi:hypothetical protein